MITDYKGIDYSLGQSNVDKSNGIRYGVISHNDVGQCWYESSEAFYGAPHCPKCGNEAHNSNDEEIPDDYETAKHECADYICHECKYVFGSESAYGDDPISHFIDDGEYAAECGDSGGIFIMKSPYYTKAQFCSPCAPGAGYLMNECKDGEKAYCFGHDWFEGDKAPYTVYRVSDDSIVEPN